MQRTLNDIASLLNAPLEGNGEAVVTHVAPLASADEAALSWLGDARYHEQLKSTKAGGVLVPPEVLVPDSVTAIRVADPDLALCQLLEAMAPPRSTIAPGVAESAIVADDAVVAGAHIGEQVTVGHGSKVGPGTQIHPGVRIGLNVQIGRDCVIWPNVVIRDHCQIGDRVVIHANTTIGTDGFGYLFRDGKHVKIPQIGTVVVEDDVEIGSNTCIDRARSGETRIGTGTKIDNLAQIAHNVRIEPHCILVAQVGISGSCTLEHHAVLAGQAGIADHVRIGAGAQIGGQAGIMHDVEAGASMMGSPAVTLRQNLRNMTALNQLSDALKTIRALSKRVEQLESAAHD